MIWSFSLNMHWLIVTFSIISFVVVVVVDFESDLSCQTRFLWIRFSVFMLSYRIFFIWRCSLIFWFWFQISQFFLRRIVFVYLRLWDSDYVSRGFFCWTNLFCIARNEWRRWLNEFLKNSTSQFVCQKIDFSFNKKKPQFLC